MNKSVPFIAVVCFFALAIFFPASAFESRGTVFRDIPGEHWAAGKIRVLADKKIIYGYAGGIFLPDSHVTRAELAAILAGAAGEKPVRPIRPAFSDVKQDQWFYSTVETAKKYFAQDPSLGRGLFRPEDFVTRQEAVAAVVRAKNLNREEVDPLSLQSAFFDYEGISPEYRTGISLAVRNRLVSGYTDKTFRPHNPLTRAEAAVLVYNAFFSEISIDALLKVGLIKPFEETEERFSDPAGLLDRQFGAWDGVDISFYIKEIPVNGIKDDRLILVFARVDPFKYFTFSDVVFKPSPGKIKDYAEKISASVSRMYPGRRIITMVGFTDLIYYDTVPQVYGSEYASYSASEGGWRVERFYSGAMSQDGKITDTWIEPQKA